MRLKLNELRSLIAEAIRKAYDILGVNSSASPEELKKAYRAKAIQLHPDRNAGVDTTSAMQNLNYAYSLLSDPVKKSKYDLSGDKTLGDLGVDYGRATPPPTSSPKSGNSAGYDDWLRQQRQKRYDYSESESQKQRAQARQDAEDQEWATHKAKYPNPLDTLTERQRTKYVGRSFKDTKGNGVYEIHSIYVEFDASSFTVFTNTYYISVAIHKFVRQPPARPTRYGFATNTFEINALKALKRYDDILKIWEINERCTESANWRFIYQDAVKLANDTKNWERENPPTPPPTPQAAEKEKSSETPRNSSKETYKIYGKKGVAPVHTRYKGKVYGGAKDSKFKVNDKANVRLDGSTLKVTNPETGHTQDWQAESVKNMSNDQLINELTNFLLSND